jgi:sirohydrochlorin ferrochelatase
MSATLLIAAHGTTSAAGVATTRALAGAVAASRPEQRVELCFLDVLAPRLEQALDGLDDVVIVPLLLSAGYHVTTDIPRIMAGRSAVRVARHLGPDPAVIRAVADRLAAAEDGRQPASTVLAVVSSSRESARAEIEDARAALESLLGRPVALLPLGGDLSERLDGLPGPIAVASYLLAEGTFQGALATSIADRGVVAAPIGVHPLLVQLVWDRFDETVH